MNQYEAMFIFDPTFAAKYENAEKEIAKIMERASAHEFVARKWDDRRLAYRIKDRKRGIYVLVYFKAPGGCISGIERDAKLSENILRVLVVRANHLTEEDFERTRTEREKQQASADGDVSEGDVPTASPDAEPTLEAETGGEWGAAAALVAETTESILSADEATSED